MKRLAILVPAAKDADPESVEMRQLADDGAARLASTWTTPEFVGSFDSRDKELGFEPPFPDDMRLYRYECMAEPKA